MMRILVKTAALVLGLAFQLPAADRRDVEFRSPEGLVLKGTYFSPGKPGRGLLLLHECGMDTSRKNWDTLAPRLAAAGFHVFAYDEPGMGESQARNFGEQIPWCRQCTSGGQSGRAQSTQRTIT